MSKLLNEGLRKLDLENLIYDRIEIDSYKSKMGEDKDIVVISFTAKDRGPAKDFMEFIEKGYDFVLDSDVSSGENSKGEYNVFVEIPRNNEVVENIKELIYGLEKLTGLNEIKFKYYKENQFHTLTDENLKKKIPNSSTMYEEQVSRYKTEEIKSFFNKTLMDDLSLESDIITFYRPFDQKIKFKLVDKNQLDESAPSMDNESIAEIFWLTKIMGDYDISKYGNTFLFSNNDKQLLLQRIE